MSLTTATFSVSQTLGAPSILTLVDTSTGSDSNIAARRVYLRKADGTYLVPAGTTTDYILWNYADSQISIDVMNKDYSLYVTVLWVDAGGATLYTSADTFVFTQYSELFYYFLTQQLAGNYQIIQDDNYYSNKLLLRVEIDSANQAVSIGGDIKAAQACLDRAAILIQNQSVNY